MGKRDSLIRVRRSAVDSLARSKADEIAAKLRRGRNQDVTVHVLPGINHAFVADPIGNPANYGKLQSVRIPESILNILSEWIAQRVNPDRT